MGAKERRDRAGGIRRQRAIKTSQRNGRARRPRPSRYRARDLRLRSRRHQYPEHREDGERRSPHRGEGLTFLLSSDARGGLTTTPFAYASLARVQAQLGQKDGAQELSETFDLWKDVNRLPLLVQARQNSPLGSKEHVKRFSPSSSLSHQLVRLGAVAGDRQPSFPRPSIAGCRLKRDSRSVPNGPLQADGAELARAVCASRIREERLRCDDRQRQGIASGATRLTHEWTSPTTTAPGRDLQDLRRSHRWHYLGTTTYAHINIPRR